MQGAFLGPSFSPEEIERRLSKSRAKFTVLNEEEIIKTTAQKLADGKIVGWFQGRLEFGPRALGNRSILADPRSKTMQTTLNLKVKYRESFRPFAPTVLREAVSDYFEMDCDSPYMLLVAPVREERRVKMTPEQEGLFGIEKLKVPRSDIPAVTHVDYSARVQTVSEEEHPRYHRLIKEFEKVAGYGVIVNTSFNVRGEPIVCSPEDAYRCFMRTGMDYLVLENFILDKVDQKPLEGDVDWRKGFELD